MHHLMYYAWISCIMFTVPLLIVIIAIVSLSGMPSENAKVSKPMRGQACACGVGVRGLAEVTGCSVRHPECTHLERSGPAALFTN